MSLRRGERWGGARKQGTIETIHQGCQDDGKQQGWNARQGSQPPQGAHDEIGSVREHRSTKSDKEGRGMSGVALASRASASDVGRRQQPAATGAVCELV